MTKLSDLVNMSAETILSYGNDGGKKAVLYDNGKDWPRDRYLVTGPLLSIFATYADLREAVTDWSNNAASIDIDG